MMILIVDTNIVFSALVKDSTTRAILLNPFSTLYAPETMISEIRKYEDVIITKSGLSKDDFNILFNLLIENIIIIEKEEYANYLQEADTIIGKIHQGDVPFIALALAILNDGIWTEDNHFKQQNRIKIWKTEDIIKFLG